MHTNTPAISPARPTPTGPPERSQPPRHGAPRQTTNDTTAPAESVRVTDVPARGRSRAYLVERELEQDGYDALKALVSDYVRQAVLLADVPMAVSPLNEPDSSIDEDLQR